MRYLFQSAFLERHDKKETCVRRGIFLSDYCLLSRQPHSALAVLSATEIAD